MPSHDLSDPGHRLSRHKLDLAKRILNMTSASSHQAPVAPTIAKACYVYIYIALAMSEEVGLWPQSRGHFSCLGEGDTWLPGPRVLSLLLQQHLLLLLPGVRCQPLGSCTGGRTQSTGPNGHLSILTSTKNGYLFEQECKEGKGIVTGIFFLATS